MRSQIWVKLNISEMLWLTMILRPQWEWVEIYPKMMSSVYPLFYSYCQTNCSSLSVANSGIWTLVLESLFPSSPPISLPLALYPEHILGNQNGDLLAQQKRLHHAFVLPVMYAHMDRAVLFNSVFFFFLSQISTVPRSSFLK